MADKKEKRYVSDNAQLIAEWDWERNNQLELDPHRITCGSNKNAWWKCSNGHRWEAKINNRNNGNGCPYCSGKKVLRGANDLRTVNPTLAKEWDYERNCGLKPEDFTANSGKKVWWKCSEGHEWQATICDRNNGNGCPYCSGRFAIKGKTDIETVNPNLAKEWHYVKNNGLTPSDITPNSNKSVWWICGEGHEWQAKPNARSRGTGCPYCSSTKVLEGYNDLQTVNPVLAKEWNYGKNGMLTPSNVMPNSNKKVWWKCSKGHEWQTTIAHRTNGNGCPVCSSERNTSLPEYAIVYYLRKYGLDVIHSYKEKGYELDIFIPSKNIAIEYDGYFWHKNKTKKDLEKNKKCEKDGIKLYRIREGLTSLNDSSIDYVILRNQKDLPQALGKILSEIAETCIDIDIDRDAISIEHLREYTEKENSLLLSQPQLAKEWDYEKNGDLSPANYASNSTKKLWWKCAKGHEWQATIRDRSIGHGCPYCAGQKVLIGNNDLQTINPSLAKEWHYEKNGDLKPSDFTANSGKKVWWKCSKGHEWEAPIYNRNKGSGCPYCAGQRLIVGHNDLQTINPDLAKEWNYMRNKELTPTDVFANSGKKVWWKCSKGHEWEATIASRNYGRSCPQCARETRKKK